MTSGYYCAIFPFCGGGKKKKTRPCAVSRVTGIPGWYWILGIKYSDTTGVGLVY